MNDAITITGISKTQQALINIDDQLDRKIAYRSMIVGAVYLKSKVQAAAPVKTGRLKRAIRIKTKPSRASGKLSVSIYINSGKKKTDKTGAYYGQFVENGRKQGKKIIPGRHFVSSTFAKEQQKTADIVIAEIQRGLEKI